MHKNQNAARKTATGLLLACSVMLTACGVSEADYNREKVYELAEAHRGSVKTAGVKNRAEKAEEIQGMPGKETELETENEETAEEGETAVAETSKEKGNGAQVKKTQGTGGTSVAAESPAVSLPEASDPLISVSPKVLFFTEAAKAVYQEKTTNPVELTGKQYIPAVLQAAEESAESYLPEKPSEIPALTESKTDKQFPTINGEPDAEKFPVIDEEISTETLQEILEQIDTTIKRP